MLSKHKFLIIFVDPFLHCINVVLSEYHCGPPLVALNGYLNKMTYVWICARNVWCYKGYVVLTYLN